MRQQRKFTLLLLALAVWTLCSLSATPAVAKSIDHFVHYLGQPNFAQPKHATSIPSN